MSTTAIAILPVAEAAPTVAQPLTDTELFIKQRVTAEQWDLLDELLGMNNRYRLTWLMRNRGKWRAAEIAKLGYLIGVEPIELVLQYGFGWNELRIDEASQIASLGAYDLQYGPKVA